VITNLSKRKRYAFAALLLLGDAALMVWKRHDFTELFSQNRVAFAQLLAISLGVAVLAVATAGFAFWRRERGGRNA
jgi:hypothetical protein